MTLSRGYGCEPAAQNTAAQRVTQRPKHAFPLCVIALALSALTYVSILKNYFISDDFCHLYDLANSGTFEFLLTPWGGHVYFVRNLIFAVFARTFGLVPQPYFLSVLITHLLNVYLLFRVIDRLTHEQRLACIGAAIWGTSPVSEGVLGWYSAYGHVLVSTMVLFLLNDLVRLADAGQTPTRARVISWYLLLLTGTACFGIGIAVAMAFPGVALLIHPQLWRRRGMVALLGSLLVVAPLILASFHLLHLKLFGSLAYDAMFLGAQLRDWRPVPEFLGSLLSYSQSSLVLPYPCRTQQSVLCSGASAAYSIALLAALVLASSERRRRLLAVALLVVAAYGIVAAGRALLVQAFGVSAYVGAMQPRFHYLGSAVLAVILCLMISEAMRFTLFPSRGCYALLFGWIAAAVTVRLAFGQPIDHHERARRETEAVLSSINSAIRMTPRGGDVYVKNRRFKAGTPLTADPVLFPGWAGLFVVTHPSNTAEGRRIHFVESDARALEALRRRQGTRIAGLLTSPTQVPAGTPVL
jgi:hypothetical protein